jgi:molybdopterin/thiamine biosynthesis adenylyltransferase
VSATLALTETLFGELAGALDEQRETAGIILAGRADLGDRVVLTGRRVIWVPDDAYLRREPDQLVIASRGFLPALKAAAQDGAVPVFFHTHPGGRPDPSTRDTRVDEALRHPAQLRSGQSFYASVIFGGASGREQVSGVVYREDDATVIDRVRVVGRRLRIIATGAAAGGGDLAAFDRQVRAFGTDGQRALRDLRCGIVGAGGTGSAVAELLLRLGVGSIVVVDDDIVSNTNLTRIHESGQRDIGKPKVQVVAEAAARIGLGTVVEAINGRISDLEPARALRSCDIVFGCTDDNRGRAVLSRLAYWYLLPVIDCAFLVDTTGDHVRGLFGRVTTIQPGTACLFCRGRIDPGLLAAEALPDDERARLAGEGYVPGLAEPDPSVGVFTSVTAGFAVNELLERLFGYGGDDAPSELLLRLHDRAVSTNTREPVAGHYCVDHNVWGHGDSDPFLDQLWA